MRTDINQRIASADGAAQLLRDAHAHVRNPTMHDLPKPLSGNRYRTPSRLLAAAVLALSGVAVVFAYTHWNNPQDVGADARTNVSTETSIPAEAQIGSYAWHDQAAKQVPRPAGTKPPADASVPTSGRTVTQQQHRQERYEIYSPEVDPKTGSTVLRKREVRRVVPVDVTSFAASHHSSGHDPKVMQLVGEVRAMKEEDENRAKKLEELRTRLELEFSQMHEKQGKEIERTGQRLESLKKLHQRRGENRDKIVQRRIDELIGKADALRWNPVSPNPPPRINEPIFSPVQPGPISLRAIAPPETQAAPPPSDARKIAVPLPSRQPRSPLSPGVPPTRVDVSASVISKPFQLARSSASANVELSGARQTLEAYKALRAEGAMPRSEVSRAESKVEQLQHEVGLNKIELEALAEALHRDLQFAEAMHQRASEARNIIQTRFDNGGVPSEKLVEAEMEVTRAEKARADARANVEQLKIALELVNRSSAQETKEETRASDQEPESSLETIEEEGEDRER